MVHNSAASMPSFRYRTLRQDGVHWVLINLLIWYIWLGAKGLIYFIIIYLNLIILI